MVNVVEQLSETEVAYIAGIIDGEGYIGMNRTGHPSGDRKLRFRVRIQIANTSVELLSFLATKVGAHIQARPRYSDKHALGFAAVIAEGPGELLIRRVLPYLVIKRRQAELYLRYREVQKFSHENRRAHRAQMKSIRFLRDWFFSEFKRLNHRGPETVEANTPDEVAYREAVSKIESELRGNVQRVIGDDAPPTIQ